ATDLHSVYDINVTDNNYVDLSLLTSYQADAAAGLSCHDGLIEWRDGSVMQHVRLPLLTATPDEDEFMSSSSANLTMNLSVDHGSWQQTLLTLASLNGDSVDGVTRLLGDRLIFEAFSGELTAQTDYRLRVAGPVEQYVDGLALNHDRAYHFRSGIAFDIQEPDVGVVSPYVVTTASAHQILVKGRNFSAVENLQVGAQQIDLSSSERSDNSLTFSYQPDSLGLKSLRLTTAAGVFTTAAAINVVEPLSPLAVYSDNPYSTTVSDTGGDKITLQLQGAGTGLRVYWLPAEDGFQVEETFRVTHALNGDKLTFSVPPRSKTSAYKVGRLYHVVVIRDVTTEQIESAVLTVIDDTAPVISGVKNYYYEQPLSINADEPMMLSAFQVERTLYANGAVTVADVTAQFEAVHKNNGKTVELAHRAGTYTEHNSEYRFTITGLTDLAGNRPATSGAMKADGRFISVSKTLDREAPVNVRLINDATGELINGATVLKRAKVHCLRIVADDN